MKDDFGRPPALPAGAAVSDARKRRLLLLRALRQQRTRAGRVRRKTWAILLACAAVGIAGFGLIRSIRPGPAVAPPPDAAGTVLLTEASPGSFPADATAAFPSDATGTVLPTERLPANLAAASPSDAAEPALPTETPTERLPANPTAVPFPDAADPAFSPLLPEDPVNALKPEPDAPDGPEKTHAEATAPAEAVRWAETVSAFASPGSCRDVTSPALKALYLRAHAPAEDAC